MKDALNTNTDYEDENYMDAEMLISAGFNPDILKTKKSVFNVETQTHDILMPMSNGGFVKIAEAGLDLEATRPGSILLDGKEYGRETPEYQRYYPDPEPQPEVMTTSPSMGELGQTEEAPFVSQQTRIEGAQEYADFLNTRGMATPQELLAAGYSPEVTAAVFGNEAQDNMPNQVTRTEPLSTTEVEDIIRNGGSVIGEYDPTMRETGRRELSEYLLGLAEQSFAEDLRNELLERGSIETDGRLIQPLSTEQIDNYVQRQLEAARPRLKNESSVLSDMFFGSPTSLGIGVGDFVTAGIMDIQEGARLFSQGRNNGSVADRGLGALLVIAGLAEATGVGKLISKPLKKVIQSTRASLGDVREALNQPGQMPTVGSNFGNLFAPGSVIPPSNKKFSATEINEAKIDTRKSASIVADRLNKIVLETERVNGGSYKPGTPNGKKWSTLPANKLAQRGGGANFNDADLDRIWNETLAEVSDAARNAVNETGATWQAFPAASWDKALSLPVRSQLWYELSGEDFIRRLPDLTQTEHMMFLDLVGATSARAEPGVNAERSLAVLSQHLRGVPIDIDLTIPSTVTSALNRGGQNVSSDLANKTGMFSDTLGIVAGLPLRYPISVNDVWVGKAFGITDDQLSANQSLHEVFGKYMNKLREQVNANSLHEFPHESWQLQARQWVEMRATDQGVDTSKNLSIEGNDYAGEFEGIIKKLEDAGIDVPGGIITRDILMRPEFADALRSTTPAFRDAPKATVEFGTLLTDAGKKGAALFANAREVGDTLTQKQYLQTLTSSMYSSGRGKSTIWERTIRLATGESDKLSRIVYPTSENPFAISGTFEGAAAPNIRVPLKGLNPNQIAYFNAMAGKGLKQKAMAAAEIRLLNDVENLPEGFVETSSIFVPWTGNVPEELIVGVSKQLGEGYEVSVAQYPNGLKIDVNPRFTDNGIESPNGDDIENVGQFLENTYNVTNIEEARAAYKSDYGKNYVEDDGTGKVYDDIIKTTLKGWTDEATSKIVELGVPKSIARQFINGKIGTIPKINGKTSQQIQSIRGKSGTIKKRLRTRIDNHNEISVAWKNLGNEINSKMESQLGSWEKRINKTQK